MSAQAITKKKITLTALAGGAFLAVARTMIVISCMEKTYVDDNAYYLPDNFAVISFAVVTALFCLLLAAASLKTQNGSESVFSPDSGSAAVTSLLCAFTLICQTVVFVVYIVNDLLTPIPIEIALIVFIPLSALFYFLRLGIRHGRGDADRTAKLAAPALLPIIYCALRLLTDFIKSNAAPMESSGAYHITSLVAALLYFYSEGASMVKPIKMSLQLAFGTVAVVLMLVYSLPNLVIHGCGLLGFDYYAVSSISDICLAAYICTRLISCGVKPYEKPRKE